MRWAITLLFLGLAAAAGQASAATDETSRRVLEAVQEYRRLAGAPLLRHRAELDQAAASRAERIAALPHSERLAIAESIDLKIREAGIRIYHRSRIHTDMVRGHVDPAAAFMRSWQRYRGAWKIAMDPELHSVGMASRAAEDGWIVLVTVFLEELQGPTDPDTLERATHEAINGVRREHGLETLGYREDLAAIARAHSEDMAGRDYFDHRSPEGDLAVDRVNAVGLAWSRVAENIQKSWGMKDPVRSAVEAWMSNPSHRGTILTPEYRESGVGVAIAEDGTFFFTQLFYTAPEKR